jgi:hypothetical protein
MLLSINLTIAHIALKDVSVYRLLHCFEQYSIMDVPLCQTSLGKVTTYQLYRARMNSKPGEKAKINFVRSSAKFTVALISSNRDISSLIPMPLTMVPRVQMVRPICDWYNTHKTMPTVEDILPRSKRGRHDTSHECALL